MEPAPFPCLPMDNFLIPFALFTGGNLGQAVFFRFRGIIRVQYGQRTDIFADALLGQTQQSFHVRADIIQIVGFCVQHHENIVHILGQLTEQFFSVQNFGILAAQADMASVNNQQNDYKRNTACNAHHNLYRSNPKLVHICIDYLYGNKPHQDPTLDVCAFIHHIVFYAVQR